MNDRLLCLDSDVFALFAVAGRLEDVVSLLGFAWEDARRLSELEPMLKRGSTFKQFTDEQKLVILEAAQRVQPLAHVARDPAIKNRLASPQINPGEQLLFAALAEQPMYWLTTGDKTAMKALCKSPDLEDVKRAVSSRVVSLEGVIYKLIQRDGYPKTLEAFQPFRSHKTISCFFPDREPPPPASPLDGPKSFLRHLCNRELGRGFLHCPPCPDSTKGICAIETD